MSNTPKLREMIFNKLLDDIFNGVINPGEKLLEKDLTKCFKVSRTPVREALLKLEAEGYVIHTKNVGAVVKKLSTKTVKETYNLLALLEGYGTEISAPNLTQDDILYLVKLCKSIDSLKKITIPTYVKTNAEFHALLISKCDNETLLKMVSDLRRKIYRLLVEGQTVLTNFDKYRLCHQNILKAISNREYAKAGNLVRSHVLDASNTLVELLSTPSRQQIILPDVRRINKGPRKI